LEGEYLKSHQAVRIIGKFDAKQKWTAVEFQTFDRDFEGTGFVETIYIEPDGIGVTQIVAGVTFGASIVVIIIVLVVHARRRKHSV
jgi:hypothetical protein